MSVGKIIRVMTDINLTDKQIYDIEEQIHDRILKLYNTDYEIDNYNVDKLSVWVELREVDNKQGVISCDIEANRRSMMKNVY